MWWGGASRFNQSRGPQGLALHDHPAAYQLVGGVMAHQGEDG